MNKNGYTLAEILTIMGIMVVLLMISSVNFFPIKQKTSLSTTVQSLISDIKQQQTKSMNGDASQGLYFKSGSYVVFQGLTYKTANATNFNVPLGDQINLSSTNFSGNQIIFATASGEIIGAQPNGNQIVLVNTVSGEQKIIKLNKFGVVTSVQ